MVQNILVKIYTLVDKINQMSYIGNITKIKVKMDLGSAPELI